jgi:hypothetical protein
MFLPSTKCCTFHPQIPNYLVGALLADDDPALAVGKERMRARIATRSRVTPRWVAPSRRERAIYRAARHEAFGRSESLLCPYFDAGACTVWPYRESNCSTFFCKHESGEDGRQVWRTLRGYLDSLEKVLSQNVATAIDPALVEPSSQMTLDDLEQRPPSNEVYASWWQGWVGREEEFYRACAARVAELSASDVEVLMVAENRRHLPLFERAKEALATTTLPPQLQLAADARIDPLDSNCRVTAYSEYDPLLLSDDTCRTLRRFTSPSPRDEVLRHIDENLALSLVRKRVLVAPLVSPNDVAVD